VRQNKRWRRMTLGSLKVAGAVLGSGLVVLGLLLLGGFLVVNGNELCGRVLEVALFGSGRASGGELGQEVDIDRQAACAAEAWRRAGLDSMLIVVGATVLTLVFRNRPKHVIKRKTPLS